MSQSAPQVTAESLLNAGVDPAQLAQVLQGALEPTSTGFLDVYVIATGRKQSVPAHYMSDPVLSRPFRRTPLSEKQQREADAALAQAETTDTPAAGDEKE